MNFKKQIKINGKGISGINPKKTQNGVLFCLLISAVCFVVVVVFVIVVVAVIIVVAVIVVVAVIIVVAVFAVVMAVVVVVNVVVAVVAVVVVSVVFVVVLLLVLLLWWLLLLLWSLLLRIIFQRLVTLAAYFISLVYSFSWNCMAIRVEDAKEFGDECLCCLQGRKLEIQIVVNKTFSSKFKRKFF